MDLLRESLGVAIMAQPDPFVVRLTGEIDIANAEQVAALVAHPDNGHGTVVFDLAGVTFVGNTGVKAFLIVADSARQFRCRNVCTAVVRVLQIVGLEEWLQQP